MLDEAERLNNLGSALATLNRHEEAVVHYRRALAIRPDLAETHNNLGSALAALGRHSEAVASFRRALALDENLAHAHDNLGAALAALDHPAEAVACYRAALALKPELADAHAGLGHALRTLGRIEEARQALEKAVALAPDRPDFWRALGYIKRYTPQDPRVAAMEALAKQSLSAPERMDWHFGLGKAYADLDRHTEAFQQLLEGNRLKRQTSAYDETATLGLLRLAAESFTAELLKAKAGLGDPSVVPVFIVGMPRSGSTLIEQILASHPQVFGAGEIMAFKTAATGLTVSGGQAPQPFPEWVAALTGEQLRRVGGHYLRTLRALAPAAERITDKELGNLLYVGLIHLALPNARIVHARRHPVDTCVSCFAQFFAGELPFCYDLAELGHYYRAYEALMEHWRAVLPPGVMLDVHYEDLVADFEPQARRLVAHCGLEWDPRCLDFHKSERAVRTASATQVRQPIYQSSVGRWRAYEDWLQPLLDALGSGAAS